MKTQSERTVIAENAIKALKTAINMDSKNLIIEAYDILEKDDGFSWMNLDVIFMEWDDLVDEANDIMYS